MKYFVLIIALVGILASCRPTRTISKAIAKKDTTEVVTHPEIPKTDTQQLIRVALNKVQQNRIDFRTFNAKVNVDYEGSNGKGYSFNTNVKIYKDSAIWVSANAILGIEAMRLLVTKDSVKLLNKIEKIYTARSIGYLQDITSLPLDLFTLQDLIIGNPVFLDSNIIRYENGNGVISLLSLGQYFRNLITLNESNQSIVRSKLDDADPARSRTADLTYSEYETKRGPLFSTRRQIVVSEKARLDIRLDFKNYNFNEPVEFPFSVPKNYQRN